MKLKQLIPMLNVSNLEQSLTFYQRALEFEVVSDPGAVDEFRWATIRSGDVELMLSESNCHLPLKKGIDPQKSSDWPTVFYFYPDDVRSLHSQVTKAGFNPTTICETGYGMREFSIQDPDGHLLSFGEDSD